MRIATLLILILTTSFITLGQKTSNLIIFSEDSTPFYAVVNGIKQNDSAGTNVKITGLTHAENEVKVIFNDPSMPELDKQIYFQEMNVEVTIKVANTNKGYKLRYFGEVSMGAAAPSPEQFEVEYHKSTDSMDTTMSISKKGTANVQNGESNMSVQTPELNNNGKVPEMNSAHHELVIIDGEADVLYNDTMVLPANYSYVQGYSGPFGCDRPSSDFASIFSSIQGESFSEQRLAKAKTLVSSGCFSTQQVKQIIEVMDFEDNKLELAKFAYDYTYDPGNYFQLNDSFSFSNSRKSLNSYITNR